MNRFKPTPVRSTQAVENARVGPAMEEHHLATRQEGQDDRGEVAPHRISETESGHDDKNASVEEVVNREERSADGGSFFCFVGEEENWG